jgi:hypothetical protein
VVEIDDPRFIECDATVGYREMALMDNFPLARDSWNKALLSVSDLTISAR